MITLQSPDARSMNLQEFQAKELLNAVGIRVPPGEIVASAGAAREAGRRLPGSKWMVKAQVHAGGRGRGTLPDCKSGIRVAHTPDEIHTHADAMLGKVLVTAQTGAGGLPVAQVYVEQAVEVDRELALSVVVDERSRALVVLLFREGGSGIEDTAARDPAALERVAVDPTRGVDAGELEAAVGKLGLSASLQSELTEIVGKAVGLFCDKDASLIEINPLAVSAGGWVALDARMSFDNNALFRQPEILQLEGGVTGDRRLSSLDGFNYLPLDGSVACLSVGAGLSMATLDAVRHYGGRPANFLDLPPDSRVNKVVGALEVLLANRRTQCLLVNVFGGGIMRCDTVADAVLLVNRSSPIRVPMIVRLSGTNSELANRRLKESIPEIRLAANLAEAAECAVAAVAAVDRVATMGRVDKVTATQGRAQTRFGASWWAKLWRRGR